MGGDEGGHVQWPADLGPLAAVAAGSFHTCALQVGVVGKRKLVGEDAERSEVKQKRRHVCPKHSCS
jgi:hypothetical protein